MEQRKYTYLSIRKVKSAIADGWTFKVLTPIYTVHWGLQNLDTLINPGNEKALRQTQTANNRKVFNRFLKEASLYEYIDSPGRFDMILTIYT
jgi:hypothetical protein